MIENHFDYNITREKITKAFDVKPGHPAYAPICAFLDYHDKEIREQYGQLDEEDVITAALLEQTYCLKDILKNSE